MAWRPTEHLMEGALDNTTPGSVTGWLTFAGLAERVMLNLEGDFHRDIRGAKIRIRGHGSENDAAARMKGFAIQQTGAAGDITAGLPPNDYVDYPYIEWYSEQCGRVVLELEPAQLEVVGRPIPASECKPIPADRSQRLFANWLGEVGQAVGAPAMCVVLTPSGEKASQTDDAKKEE